MININHRIQGLVLQYWRSPHPDAELDKYIAQQNAINEDMRATKRHFVSVVRGGTDISAAQRARISQWVTSMPADLADRSIGSHLQIDSPIARGVITALRWATPQLRNVFVYATLEAALDGALAAANTYGLKLSDAERAYALRFLRTGSSEP